MLFTSANAIFLNQLAHKQALPIVQWLWHS